MKKIDISKFDPCKKGLEYYNSQHDFETAWNNCERGDWMLWIAKKMQVDDRKLTLAKAHCANTVRHLMKDKRIIDAIDAAMKYGNGEISRVELNIYASSASAAVSTAVSIASYSAASYAAYAADSIDVASSASAANSAYAAAADAYAAAAADVAYTTSYAAADSAASYAASAAVSIAVADAYAAAAADVAYTTSYAAADSAAASAARAAASDADADVDTDTYASAMEKNQKQTADICRKYLTDEVLKKIK